MEFLTIDNLKGCILNATLKVDLIAISIIDAKLGQCYWLYVEIVLNRLDHWYDACILLDQQLEDSELIWQ